MKSNVVIKVTEFVIKLLLTLFLYLCRFLFLLLVYLCSLSASEIKLHLLMRFPFLFCLVAFFKILFSFCFETFINSFFSRFEIFDEILFDVCLVFCLCKEGGMVFEKLVDRWSFWGIFLQTSCNKGSELWWPCDSWWCNSWQGRRLLVDYHHDHFDWRMIWVGWVSKSKLYCGYA